MIITSGGFANFYNWVILLGLLDTYLYLDSSTYSTVSSLFLIEVIDVSTMSSLLLMELICDQFSSKLSTFDYSVSFSLFTFLYLMSLHVFSTSIPIKLGEISSSLLIPELDQVSNRSAKIQSASRRSSSTLYQNAMLKY